MGECNRVDDRNKIESEYRLRAAEYEKMIEQLNTKYIELSTEIMRLNEKRLEHLNKENLGICLMSNGEIYEICNCPMCRGKRYPIREEFSLCQNDIKFIYSNIYNITNNGIINFNKLVVMEKFPDVFDTKNVGNVWKIPFKSSTKTKIKKSVGKWGSSGFPEKLVKKVSKPLCPVSNNCTISYPAVLDQCERCWWNWLYKENEK